MICVQNHTLRKITRVFLCLHQHKQYPPWDRSRKETIMTLTLEANIQKERNEQLVCLPWIFPATYQQILLWKTSQQNGSGACVRWPYVDNVLLDQFLVTSSLNFLWLAVPLEMVYLFLPSPGLRDGLSASSNMYKHRYSYSRGELILECSLPK